MVAADQAGIGGIRGGQGADAGIGIDDLAVIEFQPRQQAAQRVEEIGDFRVVAGHGIGVVGADVGGTHQRAVQIGKDQADAAVIGLEIDHPALQGGQQRGVVQQDMRPLGPADHPRGRAKHGVHAVDPRSCGIHHNAGAQGQHAVRAGEVDHIAIGAGQRGVVQRTCGGIGAQPVGDQLPDQPFRQGHGGVVILARGLDARSQRWDLAQGAGARP